MHVVDEYPALAALDGMPAASTADLVPALIQNGKRVLAKAVDMARKQKVQPKAILREMMSGPAAYPIVREARKVGADLIVLGTHGRRGVRRLVLGSDAEQVVRSASMPVLLVRASQPRS